MKNIKNKVLTAYAMGQKSDNVIGADNQTQQQAQAATLSFKAVYAHAPVSVLAWDIVRAIAYSGAKKII